MERPTKPTKLTEVIIRALPVPASGSYEVSDTEVKGFRVRVSSAGTKSFQFLYLLNGERKREPLGRWDDGITLQEARDKALKMRATVRNDRRAPEPVVEETGSLMTFNQLINAYTDSEHYKALRPRTQEHIATMIEKHLAPAFGKRPLASITPIDIYEWGKTEIKRAKIVGNHEFITMRAIWNWGLSDPTKKVPPSPFVGLKKPWMGGLVRTRQRVLSVSDMRKVFEGLLEEPRDIVGWWLLIIFSGTRKGETMMAQKSEFKQTERGWVWDIPPEHTKTKTEHLVPLTSIGKRIFELAAAQNESRWLFPSPNDDDAHRYLVTGSPIVRMTYRTKVKFSPHDFRHTISTTMGELGIEPHVIDVILNHALPTDSRVTTVYNKARLWAYFDQKRAALEKWHAFIDQKVLDGNTLAYLDRAFTARRDYEDRLLTAQRAKKPRRRAA
jgi:integrase